MLTGQHHSISLLPPTLKANIFPLRSQMFLTSAGWKLEMHPYNWGTLETYPAGVQVWVGDTKQAPRGASVLQSALTNIGVQAPGWNFFMLEKQDKFALYLGPKPLQK